MSGWFDKLLEELQRRAASPLLVAVVAETGDTEERFAFEEP